MRVVIVGAGYAGLACAMRLARKGQGRVEVILINGSTQFVERIRLHESVAGRASRVAPLAELVRGSGIELRIGWVSEIDVAAGTLRLNEECVAFDRLVLALGSQTDTDRVPGVREHTRTLDAPEAPLRNALAKVAAERGRVVIVGAGLTGIELATELAEQCPGLHVELITRGELASDLSLAVRERVRERCTALRVRVQEACEVTEARPGRLLTPDEEIPFDLCVWTAGMAAPALARSLPFAANARGQLYVDAQLRSISHPKVLVIGDLAARAAGEPAWPLGCKSALQLGLHAGNNLARASRGLSERPFSYQVVPYCISLGRRDGVLAFRNGVTLVGRPAALVKAAIVRATMWTWMVERSLGRALLPRLLGASRRWLLPAPELPSRIQGP